MPPRDTQDLASVLQTVQDPGYLAEALIADHLSLVLLEVGNITRVSGRSELIFTNPSRSIRY